MEAIKKFAVACIDKLKANPTLMYVVIGLAAFIVFVLVIIIALVIYFDFSLIKFIYIPRVSQK